MLSAAGYVCREMDNATRRPNFVHLKQPRRCCSISNAGNGRGGSAQTDCGADPNPAIAQIPVIMLTGYGENEVTCLNAGADDFVIKPINAEVLRARIETQLRLHSMRVQLQQQNQELEAWRRNLERDLAAARLTQQALIPQKPPTLPGWESRPVIVR